MKVGMVDKKYHSTVWILIRAPVCILNLTSQPLITLTLTLTMKGILNVGPETLTPILKPQSAKL